MTIVRGDKVTLVKSFGRFTQVGEVYEVADFNMNKHVILRDSVTKVAVGAVDIIDLEYHFVKVEDNKNKWTDWRSILDGDGSYIGDYKTNYKKVLVRIMDKNGDYTKGKACCNKTDNFNLVRGIRLAYFRAVKKVYINKKNNLIDELCIKDNNLKNLYNEITLVNEQIKSMCGE